MKLLANSSVFFAIMLVLTSCEKVIDVQLNDASKKYVIEGIINNDPGHCTVGITQTKSFSENNDFPGISGATVTITDNGGTAIPLTETSAGNYSTSLLNGTPGHVYALKVVVGGQLFTASSAMPLPVNLDSIAIEDRIISVILPGPYVPGIPIPQRKEMLTISLCIKTIPVKKPCL